MIVFGLVVLGGMWLLFHRTRWGTLVRAATQDREMVGALGVNIKLLYTLVFGLGAALALGACAVNMGTRVIATDEAPVHINVQRQVVANSELDTRLIFRSLHNTARVARNSVSDRIAEIGARPDATFAVVADLASGARGRRRVLEEGDVEGGVWWAGQTQGLIRDISPCRTVIAGIIRDAEDIMTRQRPGYLA